MNLTQLGVALAGGRSGPFASGDEVDVFDSATGKPLKAAGKPVPHDSA